MPIGMTGVDSFDLHKAADLIGGFDKGEVSEFSAIDVAIAMAEKGYNPPSAEKLEKYASRAKDARWVKLVETAREVRESSPYYGLDAQAAAEKLAAEAVEAANIPDNVGVNIKPGYRAGRVEITLTGPQGIVSVGVPYGDYVVESPNAADFYRGEVVSSIAESIGRITVREKFDRNQEMGWWED